MADKLTVVLVEPEKKARVTTIDAGLEAMQRTVSGYIEAIYPFEDDVALVCNEEGKVTGLPLNRALRYPDGNIADIVAGTFFIVGCGEENFESLSDTLAKKYAKMFYNPEIFIRKDDRIVAIPLPEHRTKKPDVRDDR